MKVRFVPAQAVKRAPISLEAVSRIEGKKALGNLTHITFRVLCQPAVYVCCKNAKKLLHAFTFSIKDENKSGS